MPDDNFRPAYHIEEVRCHAIPGPGLDMSSFRRGGKNHGVDSVEDHCFAVLSDTPPSDRFQELNKCSTQELITVVRTRSLPKDDLQLLHEIAIERLKAADALSEVLLRAVFLHLGRKAG